MPSVTKMDTVKSNRPISPHYLSSRSADALISELRPTSISTQSLTHLNLLLDELLSLLIQSSQSINPEDIRTKGISGVFGGDGGGGGGGGSRSTKVEPNGNTSPPSTPSTPPKANRNHITSTLGSKALGREAIGEAEVELKAWRESKKSGGNRKDAFSNFPRGLTGSTDSMFPLEEALNMLRCKVMGLSTLAPQAPPSHVDQTAMEAWKQAGGSTLVEVITPASLYVTAIVEHICEHILANIGRIIERDSSSSTATLQDLYIALCEDEAMWGMFHKMEVKTTIERSLRTSGSKGRVPTDGLGTPGSPSSLDHSAATSSSRTAPIRGPISSERSKKNSHESGVSTSGVIGIARDSPLSAVKGISVDSSRKRTSSILSATTRNMLGAFDEQSAGPRESTETGRDDASQKVGTEEFDQLVKSGQTMKVSLTPSRLKNYEGSSSRPGTRTTAKQPTSPSLAQASSVPDIATRSPISAKSSIRRLISKDTAADRVDEEDRTAIGRPQPRKQESLMEVLNTEPPWGTATNDRVTPPFGAPRQVPAVIVGKPAPRTIDHAVDSQLQQTSPKTPLEAKLSPRTLSEVEGDSLVASKAKPKTTTQDLADFFKHEPPPLENSGPSRRSSGDSSGQKPTRFKSLVNRITRKTPSNTNMRDEYQDGEPSRMARKNSLGGKSFRDQTMSSAPPSAFRGTGGSQLPTVPVQRLAAALDSQVAAGPPSPIKTRSINLEAVQVMPASPSHAKKQTDVEHEHHQQAKHREPAVLAAPLLPHDKTATVAVAVAAPAVVASGVAAIDTATIGTNEVSPEEPVIKSTVQHAGYITPEDRLAVEEIESSGISNGAARVTELVTAAPTAEPHAVEGQGATLPGSSSDVMVPPVPKPTENPNIPLRELASLRGLLIHATSANECRLLVNALLSQWRVPMESEAAESPESRVTAWLLAGRDGPPAVSSVSHIEADEDTEADHDPQPAALD